MPRNDRSDSLSVRGDDDPRRIVKATQQETELELGSAEAPPGEAAASGPERERGQVPREKSTERRDAPDAPGANEHP